MVNRSASSGPSTASGFESATLNGGPPSVITAFPDSQPSGASWASNGVIYFVSSTPGGIVRVPGQGGEPVEVCPVDFAHGERTHRTPHALPDGRAVLFAVATSESESYDDASISVFATDSGRRKVLVEGGMYPRYSPSGHVVYGRNGTLFAVPFDADRLEVTGRPFRVIDGVMMSRNTGVANFDISASGDLLYVPGKADGGARTLYWSIDRDARKNCRCRHAHIFIRGSRPTASDSPSRLKDRATTCSCTTSRAAC